MKLLLILLASLLTTSCQKNNGPGDSALSTVRQVNEISCDEVAQHILRAKVTGEKDVAELVVRSFEDKNIPGTEISGCLDKNLNISCEANSPCTISKK